MTAARSTPELAHTGDMLKQIAVHYVGPGFAAIASIVFAALLLSAVNTALGRPRLDPVHALARQGAAARTSRGSTGSGCPCSRWSIGTVIPAFVVLLFPDLEKLAGLYAIGGRRRDLDQPGDDLDQPGTGPPQGRTGIFMFGLTLVMLCHRPDDLSPRSPPRGASR